MELLGGLHRTIIGVWVQGFFAFGYIYLGVMASFLRRWEDVQLSVSLPFLLIIPYYWWVVFEYNSKSWFGSTHWIQPFCLKSYKVCVFYDAVLLR